MNRKHSVPVTMGHLCQLMKYKDSNKGVSFLGLTGLSEDSDICCVDQHPFRFYVTGDVTTLDLSWHSVIWTSVLIRFNTFQYFHLICDLKI